ncbi:LysR family transcriptional regulator [Paraburkholderia phenazinium]|jgi:DNA-binding transcriptional LysR family regulator|uniref:DNA-binding transcriptional regulator, LysR family n=1 Tax=Paraburkholderia phenazinium TaxID=60549 RepID=A0A1G8HN45_9BURK|nr:LysR family transcriptional regulator [Paraburkholderia phenazinium]SDI08109.1 DNA-binding transcriptional regulator, LysR family [Paraburkholderia phenazinium]
MNQIHAMRVFVRVAETESFRRAAQQLAVSNALVTRSIATLEAHLKTRLINRTTRNVALTEAGTRYLEGCRGLLEELDRLENALGDTQAEPGGTLRLVASGALSLLSLTPLLDGFRRHYPKVNVRLTLTDRHVDLIEEGYDVGIVTGFSAQGHDLIERPLGTHSLVVCATPGYLAEHGTPYAPGQLALHAFIGLPTEQRGANWHFAGPAQRTEEITLQPVYSVNSAMMVRLGVLAGMGIAILPWQMVADDLASGALTRVMGDHRVDDPDVKVSIVYPNRQFLPAKTRSFVEHTLAYFLQATVSAGETAPPEPTPAQNLTPLMGGERRTSLHAPRDD